MNRNFEELNKTRFKIAELGYSPSYFCIYGSNNYELDVHTDEYQSDFDYKAIVVPTLRELVFDSKPVSKVVDIENGQVDVKDIRAFFSTLMKCNPAYVECMITEHWFGDKDFEVARELMPDFVWELRESFIKACYGMMLEKHKALKHPYPTIAWKIEKYGYDAKQLHHMLRLFKMMEDFRDTGKVILVPDNKDYLLRVKLGEYDEYQATRCAEIYKSVGFELKNTLIKEYSNQRHTYDAVQKMKEFSLNYLEQKIREEIAKGEPHV